MAATSTANESKPTLMRNGTSMKGKSVHRGRGQTAIDGLTGRQKCAVPEVRAAAGTDKKLQGLCSMSTHSK